MLKKVGEIAFAALLALIPSVLLWLPFILRLNSFWGIPLPQEGMATVVANYDGPLYIVVAKTFYNTQLIKDFFSFPLPTEYYAAHFPLYPLLIRLFAPVFGYYVYSMLFVTLLTSAFAIYYFHKFIKEFVGDKNAIFITAVFTIFPARWLISHSVGSADPLFVGSVLASIYHFRKGEYLKAGLWGAVAQFTKSPGILLFVAYFAYLAIHKMKTIVSDSFEAWLRSLEFRKIIPILIIPLSLVGVFFIYKQTFGNFFAYFNSGDNIHLFFPPFQIFNYSQPWVGTFWLEEIIFVYMIGAFTLIKLLRKKELLLAIFVGIFFATTLFVSHRDLIRYSLPILPFIYAAFSKEIVKKEFKFVVLLLLLPIYLFSLAFISQNTMQISDWSPLLFL